MMIMFSTLIDNETDLERFGRIYDQYRQAVFTRAFEILGDEGLAEDAVQETFLRIAANIGRYDFNRKLVLTIARNAALNILEKRKREIVFDDIEALSESGFSDGGYEYDIKEDTERIYEIVSAMPEKYSEVFYLRYSHGLNYSDISRLLGITVSTARKRVQRTKEHIRSTMKREERDDEAD